MLRRRSLRLLATVLALGVVAGTGSGSASASETVGTLSALTPAFVEAGTGPVRVVVSPDGKNVYATNRNAVPGTISEYSRNAETGVLTPLATVAAGEEPEGVVVSPDGKNVYVSDRGSNNVSQYSRNTTTGVLKALSPATVEAGEGPIGIAISPNGKSVYAANYKSANRVAVLAKHRNRGAQLVILRDSRSQRSRRCRKPR